MDVEGYVSVDGVAYYAGVDSGSGGCVGNCVGICFGVDKGYSSET